MYDTPELSYLASGARRVAYIRVHAMLGKDHNFHYFSASTVNTLSSSLAGSKVN